MSWCDKWNLSLIDNNIETCRGKTIIDHICISKHWNSESYISVIPGSSKDHDVVCLNWIEKQKSPRNINRSISENLSQSKVFLEAIMEEVGIYNGNDPVQYINNFRKAAINLSKDKTLFKTEDARHKISLCRKLISFKNPIDVTDDLRSSEYVSEILMSFPNTKKKTSKRWRKHVGKYMDDIRKNDGIAIDHLTSNNKHNKIPKPSSNMKYKIVKDDGSNAKDEYEEAEAIHGFWSNVLGKERDYNPKLLDKLIDRHLKLDTFESFELDYKLLDRILLKKRNSAPGPDGIHFELYRKAFVYLREVWADLIKLMILGQFIDDGLFDESLLFFLPKEEGDISPASFRPISVANTAYRLVMVYFAKVFRHTVDKLVSPEQSSLLEGRLIDGCIHNVLDSFYNRLAAKKDTFFLQTDFQKAYDFMNRKAILHILSRYNIPDYLINVVIIVL
jgi:hypothetical protein